MKRYSFEVFGVTDCGKLNKVNEDTFVYKIAYSDTMSCGVFAVADGVGGLKHGDIASSITISNVNKWWKNNSSSLNENMEECLHNLVETLKETNQQLLSFSSSKVVKMATTISILVISNDQYFIVHIGDSRIYKCSSIALKLKQLSFDQSCLVEKTINGQSCLKSVLTECLGYNESFHPYIRSNKIHNGEIFIVCTDGVFKKLSDSAIYRTIRENQNRMEDLCNSLVDQAKQNGETDNITMIAVRAINA